MDGVIYIIYHSRGKRDEGEQSVSELAPDSAWVGRCVCRMKGLMRTDAGRDSRTCLEIIISGGTNGDRGKLCLPIVFQLTTASKKAGLAITPPGVDCKWCCCPLCAVLLVLLSLSVFTRVTVVEGIASPIIVFIVILLLFY